MTATNFDLPIPIGSKPLIFAVLLVIGELGLIGTVFKHLISFNCRANWPAWACSGASGALVAVYCALGALVLMIMLRPGPFRSLLSEAGTRLWPLALNGAGVALAFAPVLILKDGAGSDGLLMTALAWGLGMLGLVSGLMLFLAPVSRWRGFVAETWTTLLPLLIAGAATPMLATLIRPLWRLETISNITFSAVVTVVEGLGYAVEIEPKRKIIGANDFYINVAPVCSGIEGIALVILFVTIYVTLFRENLRFPRVLWLYPIGILASALFNIVRISALLIIGLEGSPELAVGGFHSHAGWLMFTLVSLGIIGLAETVPALQKTAVSAPVGAPSPSVPFLQDPVVARILPFAVFMLSALPASALVNTPGVVYPIRVMLMGGILALFCDLYRRFAWRLDPVAVAVGAAIGLMWVLIPVEPSDAAPYGALTGSLLIIWFVLRGLGTIVFVPVIEELFFRDYLETRFRLGTGLGWRIFAACATAALFAALHDRWAEAFVAGLAFSWVIARRGNVVDAIVAHGVANALVFAVAATSGNLAII